MLPHFYFGLLAGCLPLLQAQLIIDDLPSSQLGSLTGADVLTTVISTITVVPVAATEPAYQPLPTETTPPSSEVCSIGNLACPVCAGQNTTLEDGSLYQISCDTRVLSDTTTAMADYITPIQCLLFCANAPLCKGATLQEDGTCVAAVGMTTRLTESPGEIAFEQIEYVSQNSSIIANTSSEDPLATMSFTSAPSAGIPSASPFPTSAALQLPKPIYTNFTWPNVTSPSTNNTLPSNDTCYPANPTCPACHNKTITDIHNITYIVFCDHSLDATLDYAFGEPLTAAYCLSRCDERNVTCLGATWTTEECVIALGPTKIGNPGHMAFVRVSGLSEPNSTFTTGLLPRPPISTGLMWPNLTSYADGSAPLPTLTGTGVSLPTDEAEPTLIPSTEVEPSAMSTVYGTAPGATYGVPSVTTEVTVPSTTVLPPLGLPPPPPPPGYDTGYGPENDGDDGVYNWQDARPAWLHWDWWKAVWDWIFGNGERGRG